MLMLVLIVAVFSAIETAPMPRGNPVGVAYMQDVRVFSEPPSPSGLPWQTVIAPYVDHQPPPSGWARK